VANPIGLNSIKGIKIGHAHDASALTGCTVILCEDGAICGVDQRGGSPGTRETDLLRPMHMVQHANAVLLTGGSAFGLDAATGVVKYLEEQKIGFNAGVARVPIVPAAVIFDLAIGSPNTRPDAAMGYQACLNATTQNPEQGNSGSGMGATVGKILGMKQAVKSGVGFSIQSAGGGIFVGAIITVNCFGDVVDPSNGKIIAGVRSMETGPIKIGMGKPYADTLEIMKSLAGRAILDFAARQNTVIGCIITNARLSKEEVNKVAQMAHNGLALTIRPAHTMFDGDTIFSMATCQKAADVNIVGAFAVQAVADAVVNAVRFAKSAGGLPSAGSMSNEMEVIED